MTRNEANIYLAAILETVAASAPHGAPSGHLYAAVMGLLTLDDYTIIISVAKQADLIAESSHLLTITPKGRDIVSKIQAANESMRQRKHIPR